MDEIKITSILYLNSMQRLFCIYYLTTFYFIFTLEDFHFTKESAEFFKDSCLMCM